MNTGALPAVAQQSTEQRTVIALRTFAQESRARSWWYLWSALGLLGGTLTIAALAPWWPIRLAAAFLAALLMIRGFILYHDFMHGAILRDSLTAKAILYSYGLLLLAAPRHWRESHNYHHANVGKIAGSSIGSFPLMTVAMWQRTPFLRRLHYRIARHPLTILLAYPAIFVFANSIEPFLKQPRKHWDSGLALIVHGGVIALLWLAGGPRLALFAFALPFALAATLGAYLFYAQHTFKGMRIVGLEEWTNFKASMASCSYLKLGRVMRWFTGNIGYHHIHHLNPAVPFYRLAEAMSSDPVLQKATVTTLHPKDIVACFRLNLWDEDAEVMTSYQEGRLRERPGFASGQVRGAA